jgi:hypothetical protein
MARLSKISDETWESIKNDFVGGKTLQQIADEHGVDRTTIGKRAKLERWTQDIGGRIAQSAGEKVRWHLADGNLPTAKKQKDNDAQMVEDNATLVARAVISEHKNIQRAQRMIEAAMRRLETEFEQNGEDLSLRDMSVVVKNIVESLAKENKQPRAKSAGY